MFYNLIQTMCTFNLNYVYMTLFNPDLNRGCLVYIFSLRFSGTKFLINLRRQFCARKIFSCT